MLRNSEGRRPGSGDYGFLSGLGIVFICLIALIAFCGGGLVLVNIGTSARDNASITVSVTDDKSKKAIQAVMDRYMTLALAQMQACENKDPDRGVAACKTLAAEAHKIDLIGCPVEFQVAFLKHIQALDNVCAFFKRLDSITPETRQAEADKLGHESERTLMECVRVARKHGAAVLN